MNLQDAYNNFFRDKKVGFPKFKSKKGSKRSYTTNCVNGNIIVSDGMIRLPKLGFVKMKQHRNIPDDYKLKSVTVSQNASGKYFASILFEYEEEITEKNLKDLSVWIFRCTNYTLTVMEIVPHFRDITDCPKRNCKENKENCLKW